jgi:ribosomal protein S18 acetylase RimI-like enzyme
MTAVTSPPTLSNLSNNDHAVATLVLAFGSDPVMRWTFPETHRYLTYFPELVRLMGSEATVDVIGGGAGVAVWVPPGVPTDEDGMAELLQRSIDPARHEGMYAFLGQVLEHHPTQPHWYLPVIGVDPQSQGRGHGSALLRKGLLRCDEDGVAAYLEATTPRNRALYERHGFEVIAEIQVGDSPPLWPMLRTVSR